MIGALAASLFRESRLDLAYERVARKERGPDPLFPGRRQAPSAMAGRHRVREGRGLTADGPPSPSPVPAASRKFCAWRPTSASSPKTSTATSWRSRASAPRSRSSPAARSNSPASSATPSTAPSASSTAHVATADRSWPPDRRDACSASGCSRSAASTRSSCCRRPAIRSCIHTWRARDARPAHDEADRRGAGQSGLQRRGGRDAQVARQHGNRAAALRDLRQFAAQ